MATSSTKKAKKPSPSDAFPVLHLEKWIRQNKHQLQPPVSNRQLFSESLDSVVFVSGGPNTRNDYHVNPTEELFLQLKGDIAVRLRPLDGTPPFDRVIKEGELFLLPRWVPHRPQRPAGTAGLVVEFPRPQGQLDSLRWYCPGCDELVHEASWQLKKIDEDLKIIMEDFWGGSPERRTCKSCGHVIQRAGAIKLTGKGISQAKSQTQTKKAKAGPSKNSKAASATQKTGKKSTSSKARR